MASSVLPIVLFGYDSSPFTEKIRLVLKLKQIPYTFVAVPSMMPRPVLRDNFHLTYRKIPVLAIGREVYCDTSLMTEALEHAFPATDGFGTIYPLAADGRDYRPMMRGFASFWIDRPFFRVTTGMIPSSVWRTQFGTDRAKLIGHKLDADKLEAKVPLMLKYWAIRDINRKPRDMTVLVWSIIHPPSCPTRSIIANCTCIHENSRNYANLDLQLSIMEPLFQAGDASPWIFSTQTPSLADISLYYQLSWGLDIAAGRGIANLTRGGTSDTNTEGASIVYNQQRYPALYRWFTRIQEYYSNLASTEIRAPSPDQALRQLKKYVASASDKLLVPTPNRSHAELDRKNGLIPGVQVSVAPDDTGRDDPTIGTLVALSPEEVVIKPRELGGPVPIAVRIHFPRVGFVVLPWRAAKL